MHVALHSVRARPSLRRLLAVGAFVSLIIIGLLGLHTFAAESATHTVVGASSSVVDSTPVALTVGHVEGQILCDAVCEAGAAKWPTHDDLVMACVLAVLAGLLLLLLPRPLLRRIPIVHGYHSRSMDGGARNLPRAPSLVVLSISRT